MTEQCQRQLMNGAVNMESIMARDAQMAKNLAWMANERFAERKIIVWAASFLIVRNPEAISVPDGSVDYTGMKQMGQRNDEALGDQVFTVGFTTFGGRAGAWFRPPFDLSDAPEGTLESLAHTAGLENALIPLSDLGDHVGNWLNEPLFSRPLGYTWMQARWPLHFDAMIFNRTMQPSWRR